MAQTQAHHADGTRPATAVIYQTGAQIICADGSGDFGMIKVDKLGHEHGGGGYSGSDDVDDDDSL